MGLLQRSRMDRVLFNTSSSLPKWEEFSARTSFHRKTAHLSIVYFITGRLRKHHAWFDQKFQNKFFNDPFNPYRYTRGTQQLLSYQTDSTSTSRCKFGMDDRSFLNCLIIDFVCFTIMFVMAVLTIHIHRRDIHRICFKE